MRGYSFWDHTCGVKERNTWISNHCSSQYVSFNGTLMVCHGFHKLYYGLHSKWNNHRTLSETKSGSSCKHPFSMAQLISSNRDNFCRKPTELSNMWNAEHRRLRPVQPGCSDAAAPSPSQFSTWCLSCLISSMPYDGTQLSVNKLLIRHGTRKL